MLGLLDLLELDDARAFRAGAFIQNLGQNNLTSGLEQLDQIFVGRRPGQLRSRSMSACISRSARRQMGTTHVTDHDLLRWLDGCAQRYTACRSGRDPSSAFRTVIVGIEVVREGTSALTRRSDAVEARIKTSIEASSTSETTSAHKTASRGKATTATTEGTRTSESILVTYTV